MSDTTQNIVNTLQQQRGAIMTTLHALQAGAQLHAFGAVVNGSWKARQDFRAAVEAADALSDEIGMIDLALAEAFARLQSRGRDCDQVMRELKLTGATKDE